MTYNIEGNQLHVTLNDDERFNTSIYEQLATINNIYPAYNVGRAERTAQGWFIPSGETSEWYRNYLKKQLATVKA